MNSEYVVLQSKASRRKKYARLWGSEAALEASRES